MLLKRSLFSLVLLGLAAFFVTPISFAKNETCGNSLRGEEFSYTHLKKGGHGAVHQEGSHAVKIAVNAETQKFLLREATILRMLSAMDAPDTIPRFVSFKQSDNQGGLRTEWIEGETFLASMINSDIDAKNFKEHSKLFHSQMKELLSTLSWMHKRNFLHLDIKPANIMIDPKGKLKLIDFGAAVKTDGSALINDPIAYTDGSAAPELLSNFRGHEDFDRPVGPATDMFSVGSVFKYWNATVNDFVNNPSPQIQSYLEQMKLRIIDPLLRKEPSQRIGIGEIQLQLDALEAKYLNN